MPSAWAVDGTLEIAPVAIFAMAVLAGVVVALRAYRSVRPAPAGLEVRVSARAPATSRA